MKRAVLLLLFLNGILAAQSLVGKKICLDPGHGFIPGQAANCSDAETKRFESWINHTTVPYLKQYLQREGATVITTRADYDSIGPCITLTQRKTIANNANVDYFQSVHHNAYNGTSNYSLVLMKQNNASNCPLGNITWAGITDTMAAIMSKKLYAALETTSGIVGGDYCFLGYNLGVLSTLNMPGTLSEGSFWDYIPEIRRLRCTAYLKTEAEAIYLSFLDFYKKPAPAYGSLVGIITNSSTSQPINGAKVTIPALGLTVFTDSLTNGFYRFDSLAPGAYSMKVISGADTVTTSVAVVGGKINKKSLSMIQSGTLSDVKLKLVRIVNNGLYAYWFPVQGTAATYDIYVTDDLAQWSSTPVKSVAGTDTAVYVMPVSAGKVYFLKIKAINALTTSPNFSKTYSASSFPAASTCLIVDGFNRYGGSSSYQYPYNSFSSAYANALKPLGISAQTCSNQMITNSAFMQDYKYVIWFLGDESTVDETFSSVEQVYVQDYLKQNGNLFVTGSEIAWDLDYKGTTADKAFINNYLKAKYVADNPTPNTPSASGVPGSIFNSVSAVTFGQVYAEDYPDVIDTLYGSKIGLRYNATQNAGVYYSGLFPGGSVPSHLVYLAFAFETMSDTAQKNLLINKIFSFFDTEIGVRDETIAPNSLSVQVFPNPFNSSTIINLHIARSGRYQIELFDILGNLVETVRDEYFGEGNHRVALSLDAYCSGTYLLRTHSETVNSTIKLIHLK